MSEFHVEVVRIGAVEKHPGADTLSMTQVHGGYPVIFRTGEYKPGDLAVYVPVDAVVPADDPRWAFLGDDRRIRAKRLRGVFSMGLLTPADPAWAEGQDVREALRIERHDDTEGMSPEDELDHGALPHYTDLPALRRYQAALVPGEEVLITEKLHGECQRVCFMNGRMWAGSRIVAKKADFDPKSPWWHVVRTHGLEDVCRQIPGIVLCGERYGHVGRFPYDGGKQDQRFRVFDAMDARSRTFLDAADFLGLAQRLNIPTVPVLYMGPWSEDLRSLAEGPSTLNPGHVREGIVVKPVKERSDPSLGRVILKLHGEGFLTRKGS